MKKVYVNIFFSWCNSPQWARASSCQGFTITLTHTHTHSLGLPWKRDQHDTETSTYNTELTRNRHPMRTAALESTIPKRERPQTHVFPRRHCEWLKISY